MTVLRFAPSPTGRPQLGNIRTALVNWLYARKTGGSLLLRIDDTDAERSRREYEAAILDALRWLGLDWDRLARQSDRLDRYRDAADRLRRSGLLYPAFETPEELELKRKLALKRGKPPIYDRAALSLGAADIARFANQGHKPAWRLKLSDRRVEWDDLIRGPTGFETRHLSDPVLIRPDGAPVYLLASVVDDIEFGVTHVLRGEDHVSNTAIQIDLAEALGGAIPRYGHFALILDSAGHKLSKRDGATAIDALRDSGIEPMAIASLLARIGTSDSIEPSLDLETLVAGFDLSKFGRNPPRLDEAELGHLNAKLVHAMPFEAVRDRLPTGADAAFWEAVQGNLSTVADAAPWWQVIQGPIEPAIEDAAFAATAAGLLPAEPWNGDTWRAWTKSVEAATGRRGRGLFHPLRLALTAREHGPELARLLPLIGRERALRRLSGQPA